MILVTGSSGYVASDLIPRLTSIASVCGIDNKPSENTDILIGIESSALKAKLEELKLDDLTIVNLAAARFDFGSSAKQYFEANVTCHEKFLDTLNDFNIKKFIHISSVASLVGRDISFSESLECDDAYRATKFLQERLIENWCQKNDVELVILYPSAIFSDDARSDTNIGRMQALTRYLPFVPNIESNKSITYLPSFSFFICDFVRGELGRGKYLTIEKPVLAVSEMIKILSGRSLPIFRVPGLKGLLHIFANILFVIGGFGRIDMKLTRNRVEKLFSDTSFDNLNEDEVDLLVYTSRSDRSSDEILRKIRL